MVQIQTSLLRRLHAETLPDEAPPVGKIYLFSRDFDALQDLESLKKCQHSLFYDWKHHFKPFGRDGAVKIF